MKVQVKLKKAKCQLMKKTTTKFEWLLSGWITGLFLLIWAISDFAINGLWLEEDKFNLLPIILLICGVLVIIFTIVVAKYEDNW